eukprot:gene8491-10436_t
MNSLSILNNIEEKVVESINVAGQAFTSLSESLDVNNSQENLSKFKSLSNNFFNIVEKDIHKGLIDFIDSMTDVAPFDHSSYLSKRELEVSHNFTEIILLHLQDLDSIFKEIDSKNESMIIDQQQQPNNNDNGNIDQQQQQQ